MKFENPILMGHSMEEATVMRIGAEYPDLAVAGNGSKMSCATGGKTN